MYYKQRGDFTFYNTIIDTIARDDDNYFSYLFNHYLKKAVEAAALRIPAANPRQAIRRGYVTLPRDEAKVRLLELLPENDIFAIFMASHIYLYLHAQSTADLTADVTRMARDVGYRSDVEQAVKRHTGLAVTFSDIADVANDKPPSGLGFEIDSINWNEVREHAHVAARMSAELCGTAQLSVSANEFIDVAFAEMQQSESDRTMLKAEISAAAKPVEEGFLSIAPFLRSVDSPAERRDAGRTAEANEAYAKRAEMGGRDEESWHARLQQARSLRTLKDDDGFLREALAAFKQRPQRAEPLYDLARFYREKGMNDKSVLYSEAGLALPPPGGDALFVEDAVYNYGLKEEYAIAANYARDPARKDRGFAACNWLALSREVPAGSRELARHNLRFYVQPADKMMPSFAARAVGFTPPTGYRALNPSVAGHEGHIVLVQRCANFVVTDGRYVASDCGPIKTRNFLLRLDEDLRTLSAREILPPGNMPAALSSRI